ncbi:MAG: amidase [Maricaulaceae bacterium]|nr:amidase [Maricaulaceae bacterium]
MDINTTRRRLLKGLAAGAAGLAAAPALAREEEESLTAAVGGQAPANDAGRGIDAGTIAEAEKLFDVRYTDEQRQQILVQIDNWVERMARLRAVDKPNTLSPACVFDPRLRGRSYREQRNRVRTSGRDAGPLPAAEADIAFAPARTLGQWIRRGRITSRALTELYLDRIARHAGGLECFVTVTADIARAEADAADRDGRAGRWRGPLHGVPYGLKDIIDVAGVRATWGAEPYRDRVAGADAAVASRLRAAGAVLLGKTTTGAIAYGDRWFGGMTRNPWNPEEGSSGSSAGSASAVAAGLAGFAIGTETLGSIVSPSQRCGTTGLRPSFGRVARTGAMALCWSLDKIGPITRDVEDTALVLAAINGGDDADPASLDIGFEADARATARGMRVGWNPAWFENRSDGDRAALAALRDAGAEMVEVGLPELPYDALLAVVEAESAAAFEELTLSGRDAELSWQDPPAWPNTWRRARFISAVDLVNVDRLRRRVMEEMDAVFRDADALIAPNFAAALLIITNYTGHPCLALRTGFSQQPTRTIFGGPAGDDAATHRVPHVTSLWAPLFEEGRLIALGRAIEDRLGVAAERPERFA